MVDGQSVGELELKGFSRPGPGLRRRRSRQLDRMTESRAIEAPSTDERLRKLEEKYLARQTALTEVLKVISDEKVSGPSGRP